MPHKKRELPATALRHSLAKGSQKIFWIYCYFTRLLRKSCIVIGLPAVAAGDLLQFFGCELMELFIYVPDFFFDF